MTTVEILEKTRDLISDPEHWCKGANARNKDGKKTKVFSEDAYSFCMLGALAKVDESPACPEVYEFFSTVIEKMSDTIVRKDKEIMLSVFNDKHSTTHADVLKVFDLAIKLAKEKEKAN